ncbi:MAG TPA: CocE/NonD family hydrolase [Caulobacteraceae bacterium]|nr:CocE/NonD family hydrolase [Caulobacteraceae bacterium]
MTSPDAPAATTRRGLGKLLASMGALMAAPRALAQAGGPYDMVVSSDVMIAMRDGVKLATDIYRPARDGKPVGGRFPVILERTPYGKTVVSRSELSVADPTPKSRAEVARFFVSRGYVVIYQDCRGRYASQGEFVKYLSDGADGYDTCAWIVRQPWCDGKIGTMGLSYAAHTQGALGCAGAPGVAAMVIDCGAFANAYQGGIRQGGAFELKQVTWAVPAAIESPQVANDPVRLKAMKAIDLRAWFARMPWKKGQSPLSDAPEYEDYVWEQWEHGTFDAYWKQIGIYAEGFYDQFVDAAMIHVSGWYDPYSRTATTNYMGLSRRKRGPVRLIIGPWTHGDRSLTYAGDVDFGSQATLDGNVAPDFLTLRLRWFDAWLKGERNGVQADPAVRIFVMGGGSGRRNAQGRLDHGGRWRAERDWPIPDTRLTDYHLHGDGRLSTRTPAAGAAPLAYAFDPDRPVPSIGGTITSGKPVMVGGAFDQVEGPRFFGSREPYAPLAARPDVLVFETEPLGEDVEVTGAIEARLFIASDRPDTDFTFKLIDVHPPSEDYPEGFAMNLTDGILRARYRKSWEHPEMLTPGEVQEVRIDAFPTSNLFKAGHRIRIDVSSSNFPHFDVNPNTGAPEALGLTRQVARNTLFVDAARPSRVILPIIPPRRT